MTALIGYGGHGRDIAAIFARVYKSKLLSIYDDDPEMCLLPPNDLDGTVIYGMNDPHARLRACERHNLVGAKPLVDPSAIIGGHVKLGPGVVIAPNAVLLHSVKLGPHVHVNYGVTMTRTRIKGFSTICPGVTIAGDVEIGHRCFIGAGATICNLVSLGHDVVVGAGAIIPPNSYVPNGTTVLGVWKNL